MISCPPDKWWWYLHQVGSVPMDDCTKRHATLPWRCHVYDVRIPIAVRLLLAPLLQGLHLGPHDVKSSLCMWQLSPSFCGYTLFLQWYSYTLKSHTYPGLKTGFTGKSSTLLTLSINSTSENESAFNSISAVHTSSQSITIIQKYPWAYTGSKWHTGYRTDKIRGLLKYFTA